MPVQEHVTHQSVVNAFEVQTIASNTTTVGAIIDTADYDCGLYFAMVASAYTDGTYTLLLEHGSEPALGDAVAVPADMLVYGTAAVLSAATAEGAFLVKEGVHSTLRFVRASIVSTVVTTGADVAVLAIKDKEYLPTDQDG